MKSKLYLMIFSAFALFGLFIFSSLKFNDGKMHVVFCDVGQGDATYIRTPAGADFLVDGGPDDAVLNCLSSHMPFWDRSLDAVFLTHPDADHLTGMVEVLSNYNVEVLYVSDIDGETSIYGKLEKLLKEKNVKTINLYKGDNLRTSDGVIIATLWPPKGLTGGENNKNKFSLVQLLEYGNAQILLTGDAEAVILNDILRNIKDIDIVKLPHHGAKSGINNFTFEVVKPEAGVISVGEKNRYNHPSLEVLQILKQKEIRTYRTDKEGDVEFVISGEEKAMDD